MGNQKTDTNSDLWEPERQDRDLYDNASIAYFTDNNLVDKRTAKLAAVNTQLKQKVEKLKKSEKNFKTLVENANDGIILIEGCGNIVYVNSWFGKISGYSVPELLNSGINQLIDAGEREVHLENLRARLAGEYVPIRYETKLITKSGHALPVDFEE